MNEWIIFSIGIIVAIIIIGIILTLFVRKRIKDGIQEEPNYQAFFSIGFIWIPCGVVFMIAVNPAIGIAFMALGICYMAIGLANKDKWKKKE